MRRRKYILFVVFFLLAVMGAFWWQMTAETEGMAVYELSGEYFFDSDMRKLLKKMKDEETEAVFWREERETVVCNPEFNRSVIVKAIGLAGDSSVLFPNQNVLSLGEEGYCLLGSGTAAQLFGSTQVGGKTVQIHGRNYIIAGIVYDEKETVVYELSVSDLQALERAGYRYQNDAEKDKKQRALYSYFGIR